LDKYNSEHEQAVGILEERPIGMILVDCKKLKEVLIPSPLKCLEVSKLACTHIVTYMYFVCTKRAFQNKDVMLFLELPQKRFVRRGGTEIFALLVESR